MIAPGLPSIELSAHDYTVPKATGADLPLKTLRNEGYQFCGEVAPR
jgi:hypothetical protein